MFQTHQVTQEPEHRKNAYICQCQVNTRGRGRSAEVSHSHLQNVLLIQAVASTSKQKDGGSNGGRLHVHEDLFYADQSLLISGFLQTTIPFVSWYSESPVFYQEKGMRLVDA